jgi:O-Antigen ligase
MRTPAKAAVAGPDSPIGAKLPVPVWLLLVYLAAIIIFGKGPTYLGIGPIYWGELTLGLMLGWMYLRMFRRSIPRGLVSLLGMLIFCFMGLGAVLTARDVPRWGMDALRDAAVWYYGAFFLVGKFVAGLGAKPAAGYRPQATDHSPQSPGCGLKSDAGSLTSVADRLWHCLVYIWLAAMVWYITVRMTGYWPVKHGPIVPGRGIPLFGGSGSENHMHMSLGAILLMLGFPRLRENHFKKLLTVTLVLVSAGLLFICNGRGVKVAVIAAVAVGALATAAARRQFWPSGKLFLVGLLLAWALGMAAILSGPEGLAGAGRLTRFGEISATATSGTAYWRMIWWDNITQEVHGTNPAFGLGFGRNLGELNPYLQGDKESAWPVRSPHNFNMTVFGRMGYFGLGLWATILALGLGRLFLRVVRGAVGGLRYTLERRKELAFWLMALVAIWVNSSFGVLMEGPVLGIPFWFFLGFASGRSQWPDGLESIGGNCGPAGYGHGKENGGQPLCPGSV